MAKKAKTPTVQLALALPSNTKYAFVFDIGQPHLGVVYTIDTTSMLITEVIGLVEVGGEVQVFGGDQAARLMRRASALQRAARGPRGGSTRRKAIAASVARRKAMRQSAA